MSYDTTAPVKVNETKSLVLMILLLALVGGGIWLAFYLNRPAKGGAAGAAATETQAAPPVANRPAYVPPDRRGQFQRGGGRRRTPPPRNPLDNAPEGVSHPRDNFVIVRAGATYATFAVNPGNKTIAVSRSHPRDDKESLWVMTSVVQRIVNEPQVAEHYDATAEQVEALKALHLKYPQFTAEQQKTLRDLFTNLQAAKPEDRPAAEKALTEAVAGMPIPGKEQKAFEAGIGQAREILRPDQLDLIDNNE